MTRPTPWRLSFGTRIWPSVCRSSQSRILSAFSGIASTRSLSPSVSSSNSLPLTASRRRTHLCPLMRQMPLSVSDRLSTRSEPLSKVLAMTQCTTHAHLPLGAESPRPVTEKATVPPAPLAWISRLRTPRPPSTPRRHSPTSSPDPITTPRHLRTPRRQLAASVPTSPSGTMLQDRYRLIRELGRGGMGIVYLGRDDRLNRSVAVKVILSDSSGSSTLRQHGQPRNAHRSPRKPGSAPV